MSTRPNVETESSPVLFHIDPASIKPIVFKEVCTSVACRAPLGRVKKIYRTAIEASIRIKIMVVASSFFASEYFLSTKHSNLAVISMVVCCLGLLSGMLDPHDRDRCGRWNGLISSLPDSAWHFLQRHAERVRELGARVEAFNARLGSLQAAKASLSTCIPDELNAACEQLIRERNVLAPEADDFISELNGLIANDARRKELLFHYCELEELERGLHKNDNRRFRDTCDITVIQMPIQLREKLEERRERLLLTSKFVARALKIRDARASSDKACP